MPNISRIIRYLRFTPHVAGRLTYKGLAFGEAAVRGIFFLSLSVLVSCGVKLDRNVTREVTIYDADAVVSRLDSLHRRLSAALYSDSCEELVSKEKPSMMPYFETTPHLGCTPGFVLDYVYDCGPNASPLVYARRATDAPVSSFAELETRYGYRDTTDCGALPITNLIDEALGFPNETDSTARDLYSTWRACKEAGFRHYEAFRDSVKGDCFSAIVCDGTPEGIFELAVFRHMYDRFALKWHATVKRQHVVCSPYKTRRLIEGVSSWIGKPLADSLSAIADSLDYSVNVVFVGDTVRVSYTWFAPGGGIARRRLTMLNAAPWQPTLCRDSVLARSAFAVIF